MSAARAAAVLLLVIAVAVAGATVGAAGFGTSDRSAATAQHVPAKCVDRAHRSTTRFCR